MNLVDERWIPVMDRGGKRELVSIREVLLEAERWVDMAVLPHEYVSLLRLLLCILHAAVDGPKDIEDWERFPSVFKERVGEYLDKWKERFNLFDDRWPFLQMSGIRPVGDGDPYPNPAVKLVIHLPSGNNPLLFYKKGDELRLSPPELALALLTFQNFSTGGTIGAVKWHGVQTKRKSNDAPCIPASMYHGIIQGRNMLETLHWNLVPQEEVRRYFRGEENGEDSSAWWGRPVWEFFPERPSAEDEIRNATRTYLGRLVPLKRLVLLSPDGDKILLGDGLDYPLFPAFFPEPTATVVASRNSQQKWALLSCRPDIQPWRELAAITVKRKLDGGGGPLALGNLRGGEEVNLRVMALVRSQAKYEDAVDAVYHLHSGLLTETGRGFYEGHVKEAEKVAAQLGTAVKTYRDVLESADGQGRKDGTRRGVSVYKDALLAYWTGVEGNLDLLWRAIDAAMGGGGESSQTSDSDWEKMLLSTARGAYERSCPRGTPRQFKAFVEGWKKLPGSVKELQQEGEAVGASVESQDASSGTGGRSRQGRRRGGEAKNVRASTVGDGAGLDPRGMSSRQKRES